MPDCAPYVMTPVEVARGVVLGQLGGPPGRVDRVAGPRAVLENVLRGLLERPPCGVAFSGGRDSSLVLALATHVARREGLPPPVALTKVFPEAPDTHEAEWQETVIRHLEVKEWHRIELRGELELIGALAGRHLRTHGVLWPPVVHGDVPLYHALGKGTLIDGEGGDEVLGVESHRVAPLTSFVHARGRRSRRGALVAMAPRRVREQRLRTRWDGFEIPWLRPEARAEFIDELVSTEVHRPLSFRASVGREPARRARVLGQRNRQLIAAEFGVETVSPLLDPAFVASIGRAGRWLGLGDRTDALRGLAADLLPDSVLTRTSKATFAGAYWGPLVTEFARGWTGVGVDPRLVDPGTLRTMWVESERHAMTSALLQQAWLGSAG